MDPIEQLALAGEALGRAATEGLRRGFAMPWLWHFALHAAAVVLLWNFAHPAFSEFVAPVMAALAGPAALHYPDAPLALPAALAHAERSVAWLLTPLVAAWSAALVGRRMRPHPPGHSGGVGDVLARVPVMIPVGALVVLARNASIGIAADALAGVHQRPMMSVAVWCGATAGEFALLTAAALLLPLLVIDDVPITQVVSQWAYAWHSAGAAAVGIAAAMVALGVAWRFAYTRLGHAAVATPDLLPPLAIAGALAAAMGGALFCIAATIAYGSLVRDQE